MLLVNQRVVPRRHGPETPVRTGTAVREGRKLITSGAVGRAGISASAAAAFRPELPMMSCKCDEAGAPPKPSLGPTETSAGTQSGVDRGQPNGRTTSGAMMSKAARRGGDRRDWAALVNRIWLARCRHVAEPHLAKTAANPAAQIAANPV